MDDDGDADTFGAIILQMILIFLNAVFASAELAVISVNGTKLEKLANDGNKKAARLISLTANPAEFLATIQVAITLAGFLGSAYAADNFASPLVAALLKTGISISENALNSICVFLITLIIAYFSIVFGELIPKRIAMQKAESMSFALSGILTVVSKLFAPLVWLLTASTNGVLHLMGIDPNEEEPVTEEEIRMMVEAGSENGTIDSTENEMIQNIFEFNDTPLEEICTHRREVICLYLEDDTDEWNKIIYSSRHNYYPICGETNDDIVGILDAKDYLRMEFNSIKNILDTAVRKPCFVPESMKANVLFRKMKKSGCYFSVVLDEYGGMSGIVTMRDLLELLVGELTEDTDEEKPEDIIQTDNSEWIIQGSAPLETVAEQLKLEISSAEYDTFSGYICGFLGEVPDNGTSFDVTIDGLEIHVNSVKHHKIEDAIVRKCG